MTLLKRLSRADLSRTWRGAAAGLILTFICPAQANEVAGYGFAAAAQEISQLFWLAETATACGWAEETEATRFMAFSIRFLTAHLSPAHQQALVSLISQEHYKSAVHRAASEGAPENCTSSRWRLGWLSFKAAADQHEHEF